MISTWIIVLYFCVTSSCFTVVLPTEYMLLKECNFYNKVNYPNYNKMYFFSNDIKIQARCVEPDILYGDIESI